MSEVKNIPDGWMETTLGEVCNPKGGKRLPKGMTLVNYKTDHPYIRITDFNGNQINKNQLQFVTDDIFKHISRYIVNENDVIISIVGTVGLVAKIDNELDNASLTENCSKLVDLKNIDSDFLYYFLISKKGQDEINKNSVGAVQKKLPIYGVQNIKIELPKNINEQKSIAAILTAFDNKIELLQAQNKTLEETAQTIFKEWFGKYSVDDELPDGWRVETLGTIATLLAGGDRPKNTTLHPTEKNSIPIYSNGITNYGLYGFTDTPKIFDESVTVSARGTIGFPCLRTKPYVPIVRLISVIPNQKYLSSKYLFLWLKNQNISGTGTTQEQLTIPDFKRTKIIIPPFELMNKFSLFMNTVYDKIDKNNTQIQTLTKTRDELLPRLMSGEIRVNEFKV